MTTLQASAVAGTPSHHGTPAAAGTLCNYDDGNPIAAYLDLSWGRIGWCSKHLSATGDWPARLWRETWE